MSEKTTSLSHPPNRQHDGAKPENLLDQVSEALRAKHYSIRTEQTYIDWVKCFILFLYREVVHQPLETVQAVRARKARSPILKRNALFPSRSIESPFLLLGDTGSAPKYESRRNMIAISPVYSGYS